MSYQDIQEDILDPQEVNTDHEEVVIAQWLESHEITQEANRVQYENDYLSMLGDL